MIPTIINGVISVATRFFSKSPKQVAADNQAVKIISDPKKYNQAANINLLTGFNKGIIVFCIFVVFGQWLAAIFWPFLAHKINAAWHSIPDWQEEAIKAYCLSILSVKPLNSVVGAIADGLKAFKG